MSALGDLLDGAVREDVARLDGASFAEGAFGAVRGRVSRRRAARAAGIGGASALGVGAVAIGAGQVPWGGLGFGFAAAGPSVVCTTNPAAAATNDLTISTVQISAGDDTDGLRSSWVVVLGSGGPDERPLASLHLDGEVLTASVVDGDVQTVMPDVDGLYTVALADGSAMKLKVSAEEIAILSFPASGATAAAEEDSGSPLTVDPPIRVQTAPVDGFAVLNVGDVDWEVAQDDVTLATAHREGDTMFFTFADGTVKEYDVRGVRRMSVDLPNGTTAVFKFDGASMTYEGTVVEQGAAAAQAAIVTCVTESPESPQPTESTVPSPSASPAVTPSSSPRITPSGDPVLAGDSPFQCGTELAEPEHGEDEVSIGAVRWMSAADANAEITGGLYFVEGEQLSVSGDDVPVVAMSFDRDLTKMSGGTDLVDPAEQAYGFTAVGGNEVPEGFVIGAQFVAVNDGVVVATGSPVAEDGYRQFWAELETEDNLLYLLNAEDGLVPCEGVSEAQMANANFAVAAGIKALVDGEEIGPLYAWKVIEPEGE